MILLGSIQANTIVYAQEPEEREVVQIEVRYTEEGITQKIRETFPEQPETMLKIAKCESNFNYKIVSPTNDHGLFQINQAAHGKRLKELGIDPLTVDGNLQYARMLYDERGTQPWYMSEPCWNK